jgi:hypothetical protein
VQPEQEETHRYQHFHKLPVFHLVRNCPNFYEVDEYCFLMVGSKQPARQQPSMAAGEGMTEMTASKSVRHISTQQRVRRQTGFLLVEKFILYIISPFS